MNPLTRDRGPRDGMALCRAVVAQGLSARVRERLRDALQSLRYSAARCGSS
jgi:hypothetical protein